MSEQYTPPKVWVNVDTDGGNKWANINSPESGARFEKELPIGDHAFQLYFLGTPNGQKVTILLEELLAAGVKEAEYDAYLINIGEAEQFSSGFVGVESKPKIPALVDKSGAEDVNVFESASILMHLAENLVTSYQKSKAAESQTINWFGHKVQHHS